ncbi:hypothetical protein OROGR_015086 [Orobanche gracilis]
MVVAHCFLSLTCTAVAASGDSPNHFSSPFQLRPPATIILPNKKPLKWSTGVSPGDFGGSLTSAKLRKYWGGDEDPLAFDDYLWNKGLMGSMKKLIQEPDDADDLSSDPRFASHKCLEIDFSKELAAPSESEVEAQIEEQVISRLSRELVEYGGLPQQAVGLLRLQLVAMYELMLRESRRSRGDPQVLAAQSMEQYYKLKNKLQVLTLGIGGIGVVWSYFSYSPEIAASYGAGLLGSLAYLRMLGNSVDSLADGAGLIKRAMGQPRLLIPVVLVVLYNRWNGILVPDYGFLPLDLIPMFVGFFTYKMATLLQVVEDVVNAVGGKDCIF